MKRKSEAYIFTHAYDFPTPGNKPWRIGLMKVGPWMKPHMDRKGITDAESQRAIMTFMLKRLDELISLLFPGKFAPRHLGCYG